MGQLRLCPYNPALCYLPPKGEKQEEREKTKGRKDEGRGERKIGGVCQADCAYLEGEDESEPLFFPNVDFNI